MTYSACDFVDDISNAARDLLGARYRETEQQKEMAADVLAAIEAAARELADLRAACARDAALIRAARAVVARWESGDLAGAVRDLDAALQDLDEAARTAPGRADEARRAVLLLRKARDAARAADAPRLVERIRAALASADGARRHAWGRELRARRE